jgi:hypothetical protein
METMDLSDSSDSSMMTPIQNAIIPEPEKIKIEKNMNNIEMDSTPLSELMSGPEVFDTMPTSQDPRIMHAQSSSQQPKQSFEPSPRPKSKTVSKTTSYPFNLTEEQMDSLIAGAAAVISFSKITQDKLANVFPSAIDEAGTRTTIGIIVTALIAAISYYIIKKFVMPKPQHENN